VGIFLDAGFNHFNRPGDFSLLVLLILTKKYTSFQ